MKKPNVALFPLLLAAVIPGQITAQNEARGSLSGRLRVQSSTEADLELRMTPEVRAVQRGQNSVVCVDLLQPETAGIGESSRTEGTGSGVILDGDGLVITNWHVIAPVELGRQLQIQIRLFDGRSRPAKLLSSSPRHDLAILQMQLGIDEKVDPIDIGDSKTLMVGETVLAIGNPQGHAHTVTAGVLSAIDREITVRAPDGKRRKYEGLLQTDAAINRGNSGGALLDITGRLVGINNAMAMGSENIGFAIPVDTMLQVFEEVLLESGNLSESWTGGYLGFRVEKRGDNLVVSRVDPGSPAALAGLTVGDEITKIGPRAVRTPLEVARTLVSIKPGDPVAVTRKGTLGTETLRPVPVSWATWRLRATVGLALTEVREKDKLDKATRMFFGRRSRSSFASVLQVEEVLTRSAAEEAGLKKGDLVLGVKVLRRRGFFRDYSDLGVSTTQSLFEQLQRNRGSNMDVIVLRDGDILEGPLYIPNRR